ncbi:MAG: hypothetical protein HYS27_16655 [Deltaproteobacteria bacterium]|nr:hypothetical protein [Deltaproteobacteria bacterium]
MRTVALAAAVLLAAACATPLPHLEIPRAPTDKDAYELRAAYFKTYAPDSREYSHIFLHGGDRVYWPEDLAPAVDDESPTAKAIRDYLEARDKAAPLQAVSGGSMAVFGVGMLGFLASPFLLFIDPLPSEVAFGSMAVTGTVSGVALVVGLGAAMMNGDEQRMADAADRASRTYPQSLSDRVGIHIDANGNLIDSNAGAAPGGATPPAGPTTSDL